MLKDCIPFFLHNIIFKKRIEPVGPDTRKLLIIDDSSFITTLIRKVCASLKIQCDVCKDPADGLHRMKMYTYDVVLCDINFNLSTNGNNLIKEYRNWERDNKCFFKQIVYAYTGDDNVSGEFNGLVKKETSTNIKETIEDMFTNNYSPLKINGVWPIEYKEKDIEGSNHSCHTSYEGSYHSEMYVLSLCSDDTFVHKNGIQSIFRKSIKLN